VKERFPFAFDEQFRLPLLAIAVSPRTAYVELTDDRLVVRFGFFSCETELSNVKGTCHTGPYRWYKAIGPRGSLADRGATFGTSAAGGTCVLFHEPVRALDPIGLVRHPGLTVTLADPEVFETELRRRARLP
jgi:hypothetical protein